MFIRVSGAEFAEKLANAVKGKKEVVNFLLKESTLYLQTMGVVRHNIRVSVIETDMDELDASYVMDKMLGLLSTRDDVYLYFSGDLLRVAQTNFEFNAMKSYEERIENDAFEERKYCSFNRLLLSKIVTGAKQLDVLARSLGVGYSSLQFKDGSAYLMYSNMFVKWEAPFIDMSISIDTLKWVIDKTSEYTTYYFDSVTRVLYFYISYNEILTVEVNEVNPMVAETYQKMLSDPQRKSLITLGTKYNSQLEVIAKGYDKTLVDVSFCEDGNVRIYIDNVVTRFAYGSGANALKTIRISTVQLSTMLKLLGSTRTEVEIGDNKLWLRQLAEKTDLVIAGMLF